MEKVIKTGSKICPNCGGEPNWINLNFILHEELPLNYHHWLCWDCFHTWYDVMGPGEELKEENMKLFEEWDLAFAKRVVFGFEREFKRLKILTQKPIKGE